MKTTYLYFLAENSEKLVVFQKNSRSFDISKLRFQNFIQHKVLY